MHYKLKNSYKLLKFVSHSAKFAQYNRAMSSHPFIEKKVAIAGNILINCVQSGEGNKSVLLMPGALGSSWTDFKPQIELLPKLLPDYTIISWDPPGYGKSIPPNRTFPLDFFHKDANYANQLMHALDRPKYSVLGWSDGGITALILAGTYQDAVEKLVTWGAGAYINEGETKVLEGVRDVNKWSQRMREPMEKIYGPKEFAKLWSEWVDGALAIYKEKNGDFCKKEVENIVAKTLIVHGQKDPLVASEHIPYLREKIKGCKYYEFPHGKHNIHLRYADEFNKIVSDFIKS